jgi:hypothetical protein
MRLEIELWYIEQGFSQDVNTLFDESVKCYKASAYKAALLFSFLGFQTIIRERILRSVKPDHLHPSNWERIHTNLRNDDKWDSEVIECIKKSDPGNKIFDISEDLRHQVIYWKNRRNDCAHSKNNLITDVHVESFWYFIKSNLTHFYLPGGLHSLLNKLRKHLDLTYTPADKPFDSLVIEAKQIINRSNSNNFVDELLLLFQQINPFWPAAFLREFELIESLLLSDALFVDDLLDRMAAAPDLYLNFVEDRPGRIEFFLKYEELIRRTWTTYLFVQNDKISLLSSLLRCGVIPDESYRYIFSETIHSGFDTNINELDKEI